MNNIPMASEVSHKILKASEECRIRESIDAANCFFATHKVDILILAKDSAYYQTAAFVKAARSLGIPSVVMPYDRADSVTLAQDRVDDPRHMIRSFAAKKIAKKYPSWVYFLDSQPLLLVDPATVYAMEQLNLSPPNPWAYNSSRCDKIFLETEEDRQLYLNDGAPTNQLAVVGATYMDSIDANLNQRDRIRAHLCTNFGFNSDKPFVVASVSPNKISQRPEGIEFKSYRDLIDKWSTALVRHLDCNLIYSLHPLTFRADVEFIEKKGGKILDFPLEELIAIADMYVVDCSSTSRWAQYAGIDVIDYDFYKYNLWFNSKLKGITHITTYNEFISELIKANEKLIKSDHQIDHAIMLTKQSFKDRLNFELNNLLTTSNQQLSPKT